VKEALDADLERCVGDTAVFAAEVWRKRPYLHRNPEGFADLFSLDDVDHLISSAGIRLPAFRLVRQGKVIPPSGYTKTTRTGSQTATGVADSAAVLAHFDQGATIVLQGVHRYWSPVAMFARNLEGALGHPVQVNAYVTPPGSQGFAVHKDDHDVFVLQSHGTKSWVVHEQHDLPPTRSPLVEAELEPGDSLYIPKNFPHSAATQTSASVHLTVGILTIGTKQMIEAALSMLDGELDEPLPLRFADDRRALASEVEVRLERIAELLTTKLDAETVGGRLQRRFFTTRQPLLAGQMRRMLDLDKLSDQSMVGVRAGALCLLQPEEDELAVLLGDRELRMPAWLHPVMAEVIERGRVRVGEIALDSESRLVLVRRLIKEGLLEVLG
jgi:bifunctional lysine-specific demethylase and histidyl-hydroxylase NO66